MTDNVNGIAFLAGLVVVAWGVASWSVPLAAVVVGGVVMLCAALPYLRRRKD